MSAFKKRRGKGPKTRGAKAKSIDKLARKIGSALLRGDRREVRLLEEKLIRESHTKGR